MSDPGFDKLSNLDEANEALNDLRALIDEVDLRILALFNERANVVTGIGDIKRQFAIPIYEPKREEEVFRNVLAHNGGPLSQPAVRRLFERIIDEMRTLQRERMDAQKRAAHAAPPVPSNPSDPPATPPPENPKEPLP